MLFIISVSLVLNFVNGIYIPPENVTANKFTRAGIKTLSWHYQESPNIIVHHNYSKVILHQPDEPKNYNYSHSTSNINSNQKLVINDQLDEFRTTQQENQDLNQDSLRNKLKLIREQIPNPTAEDSTTRPFTNAHSGGYPPVKSEKLRLKLLVNPQEIRSAHEEIEVYKKCPSGATGQFVTELSCNQFLNCWKGRGYIQNCPPGTLFNPRTLQCDFKHKVSCVSGPRQAALTEKEALSEALQARCPQGFSGIIPHYTNCAKFINCNNGVEFVMDCAPGTLFDTKTNMCDYPHKATCADKEDNEDDVTNNKLLTIHGYNSNITYQIPARNINDHLQEFKYHNLNRQGRYDKVGINDHLGQFGDSNFVEALATAEHNQWFTQTPIYIGNVTSTSKIDFGHQNKPHHGYPKATPNETSPKCPAGASGLFPHPTICEKFLNCDHGRTFIQDCGPGTVFNPNFKVCDFPYNVDCDTKTAVADLDQTAAEIEEDTNRNYRMVAGLTEAFSMGITQSYCENKSGFWIYPQNCSRFIFCNDGQLFIGICSEDMNFNPEKADCREDIDCLSVLNQYGGGQQPVVQDLSTEYWRINTQYQYFKLVSIGNEALVLGLDNSFCQINPGFSIHPRDCSKFLLCTSTGVLLLGVCNSKTYYNPQIQSCQTTPKCDHIRQFGTQNFGRENWQANTQYQYFRLISIGNEGYALGLDRNFCQNNPGFSIHPRNCSKFLLCTSDGRLLLGICNPNTYYDPNSKSCQTNPNCGHIQQQNQFGSSNQENWQANTQYQYFRLINIGNEAYALGLDRNFCQNNPGVSIHPRNCSKFLLCTSDGRLLLGICNSNTYYDPNSKSCQTNPNCGHIQQQNQFGSSNQENWQANTQYQYFRLISVGNEAYTLGLDHNFCQNNPGVSIHPRNCSKFLLCTSDGRLLLGICNSNTYYNPNSKSCQTNPNCGHIQEQNQFGSSNQENWQANTHYQYFRLINIGNEAYTLGLDHNFCQNNPGVSIHPRNCAKFLLCTSDGRLLLGVCNANTYYDPNSKSCQNTPNCTHIQQQNQFGSSNQENWQANTQYQYFRLISIGYEAYALGLDQNFCQINPGFSIHPKTCSKFLLCSSDGRLLLGICNANTYYNPSSKNCESTYICEQNQQFGENWQANTQYQYFRLVDIGNEAYNLGLTNNYCQNNLGFSTHPKDCSKFLLCTPNAFFLGICNSNTFYNPVKRTCDSSTSCKRLPEPQSKLVVNQQYEDFMLREAGNEMNMLALDMHYCLNNEGFSTHPKNCSKFLLCQNGILLLGICNSQKYFNPSSRKCESTYKCTLGSSNQDDIGLPNPEGLQWQNQQFGIFVFKNDSSLNLGNDFCGKHDGFTVHPVNCHKFLFCKFGRLYLGQCKINMIYNHNLKTCDFSTKCPQSKSSLVGDLEISCDSKPDGLYRHPTACTKFIRCQNAAAHIHDCASGTLFNPVDKNCDFPHNVNCNVDNDNRNNENETEEERWQRYWDKQNPSGSRYKPTSWQDQWDQNQNSQWDQDQNQNSDWQSQNNQWSDQNNQWSDQDQNNQWGQDQNNYGWDQYFDQHNNWLPTEAPAVKVVDVSNVVSYDQNKKPTNQWPPPFPSTDPDADYVFELNDLVEPVVPEKRKDDAKVKNETCGEEDFHCTETICIEYKKVCDESADCPDGEDEKNCDEYIDEFSYVPSTQMAVKEEKRYENITLALCAKYCIESKGFVCKAFNFRKLDGICFLLATNVGLSGSLFVFPTYDYFEYEKYSINCPKELQCPNQKCIEEHQVCDGIKDCVDRYDEKDCTAEELGYSVRLVGSQKSYEGAVEVTALGKTGYVCDDNFYMASAHVLCKELGYHLGATEIKGNSYFTPDLRKNETFFIMDDVVCNGNEAGLKDCSFAGWGVSNCMEKEVLGIVCKTPEERCAAEMWQCESNDECIPMTFLCDNVEDCADYSDEDPAYCEAPLEMRLIGGQTPTEGRVEIRHHATWGTICDDDFNDDAARVVCKSLGFLGPARALKEAHFGPGSGPIWLDQVFCHGNETSLNDCIKWDWGVHNCDHSEDVSVVCNAYHNSESPRHSKASLPASSEPILVPDRCGYRNDDIFLDNPDVHFRVVQGSKAKQGQYPWQASLRVKGPTSLSHWCGAVVISAKFVLTAAHCLHGFTKGAYIVVAGDYDVNTEEGSEQQVYIDEFYIHEEFRKGTKMNNDIALIRLKGSGFNITRDVQPICLPDADFTDETGLNCTISGFGSVRSGRAVASKELRAGWIPIQPSDVCKMPHIYGNTITEGMICAGTLDGGVDACDGDSGGPLACLHNGLFTLVGMTSWGQHCGEANKPGVYVKIAHYRKWIDETMEKYDEID